MMVTEQTGSDRVLLHLDGTFDSAEAWRLHDVLAQVSSGTVVTLDFTRVRAYHDFAVALLAKDLVALQGRIVATGLCQHQLRILRYFGIEDRDLGEPFASQPAPDAGEPLERV
jgi:anti-anti-sigma regulatory factor